MILQYLLSNISKAKIERILIVRIQSQYRCVFLLVSPNESDRQQFFRFQAENPNVLISVLRNDQAWYGGGCILRYPGGALDRSDLAEVNSLRSVTIRVRMIDVCPLIVFVVAALDCSFAYSTCRPVRKTGLG